MKWSLLEGSNSMATEDIINVALSGMGSNGAAIWRNVAAEEK
jgi:chemotaxis response regulator CheB